MKTIDEVEKYLRHEGVSGVLVKRIVKLSGEFATIDSFFAASQNDIVKAYTRITPYGKHGLGRSFWPVFDKANSFYRGFAEPDEKDARKEPEAEKLFFDPEVLRMISLDELKTVVAFMELCDVESINIVEITAFLKNVKIRQKKPDVKEAGQETKTQEA